jgi:hypothetical protein
MNARREALLKEYGEVANNFRTLTDIRFRMLSFLPIISGLAAAGVAIKGDLAGVGTFTLALLGLMATMGLATYNARNDQLYDELVSRAAAIERSLGLPDGQFANRPCAWLTIRIGFPLKINHRTAVAIIYAASAALWLNLLFAGILELARRTYLYFDSPLFLVSTPSAWVNAIALVLAIGVTALGALLIEKQSNERKNELRKLAARAYQEAISRDPYDVLRDSTFIEICATLANDKGMRKTQARAQFYARVSPDSLGYYMSLDSPELQAAHLVALLTDFPPLWVFKCGEGLVTLTHEAAH